MRVQRFNFSDVRLEDHGDSWLFFAPYNKAFVISLKSNIPSSDRKYEDETKSWRILPKRDYGELLNSMTEAYFGQSIVFPPPQDTEQIETSLLEVHYIGKTKDRGGDRSAFGWCNNSWSVIFPEKVLRAWFDAEERPGAGQSFYALLGIARGANVSDIKSAFWRLSRQWHPDVCKEQDAAEMFMHINHAFQVLSDPTARARYDAGLLMQSFVDAPDTESYRSPLRCGWIMAEGTNKLGRFEVKTILQWLDLVNEEGKTLVASWRMGDDKPTEKWI